MHHIPCILGSNAMENGRSNCNTRRLLESLGVEPAHGQSLFSLCAVLDRVVMSSTCT